MSLIVEYFTVHKEHSVHLIDNFCPAREYYKWKFTIQKLLTLLPAR